MEGEAISRQYRNLLESLVLGDPARAEFIGRGLVGGKRGRKPLEYSITKCKKERVAANKVCRKEYNDCIAKVNNLKKASNKLKKDLAQTMKQIEKVEQKTNEPESEKIMEEAEVILEEALAGTENIDEAIDEVKELVQEASESELVGEGYYKKRGGAKRKGPTKKACKDGRKACRLKVKKQYNDCVKNVKRSKLKYTLPKNKSPLNQYNAILKQYRQKNPNVSINVARREASKIYKQLK